MTSLLPSRTLFQSWADDREREGSSPFFPRSIPLAEEEEKIWADNVDLLLTLLGVGRVLSCTRPREKDEVVTSLTYLLVLVPPPDESITFFFSHLYRR